METYIAHHGVKGMKWGIRRYETEDGHLTEAGKKEILQCRWVSYKERNKRRINKCHNMDI